MIQHGPLVTTLPPPHLISVSGPRHGVVGVSLAHSVPSMDISRNQAQASRVPAASVSLNHGHGHVQISSDSTLSNSSLSSHYPSSDTESGEADITTMLARTSGSAAVALSDGAGPSSVNAESASPSDSDSLESDSPGTQFAAMLYRGRHFPRYENDSDDYSAVELESGDSISYRHGRQLSNSSGESQPLTSDPDDSSGLSDSDSDVLANPSTLRLINTSAATMNVPPSPVVNEEASSSEGLSNSDSRYVSNETDPVDVSEAEMRPTDDEENTSLPPLISINSDSETPLSQVQTPPSVIDLTVSSVNSSPSVSELNVSPHHSSTLRDPRIFRDQSPYIVSSNLFRESASEDVVIVPGRSSAATEDETRRCPFAITSTEERTPVVGGVVNSQSRDFHRSSHSVVQLAQPHTTHLVAIQQQQLHQRIQRHMHQQQQALLHGHNVVHPHANNVVHPRANNDPTTQSIFPYSSHVVHGGENSGVVVQQVTTLPHPSLPGVATAAVIPAAALPMDPGSSINQSVHVLAWPQHLAGTYSSSGSYHGVVLSGTVA